MSSYRGLSFLNGEKAPRRGCRFASTIDLCRRLPRQRRVGPPRNPVCARGMGNPRRSRSGGGTFSRRTLVRRASLGRPASDEGRLPTTSGSHAGTSGAPSAGFREQGKSSLPRDEFSSICASRAAGHQRSCRFYSPAGHPAATRRRTSRPAAGVFVRPASPSARS